MRISASLPPGPEAPALAALAEELGYERVWFYDSPALYGDCFVAMARTLDRTRRIGVGTAVLVPSTRHVATTAAAIGSLEAQAPGRVAIAIGTGFTARQCFGQKALPWARVRAYVEQLRALLRGEETQIDGRAARLLHPDGLIAKRPIGTPILLGVAGPVGLAIADEIADGVMCAGLIPEGVRDAVALCFGTVFGPGEGFESPRVLEAIGAAIAVVYHGSYAVGGAAGVDALPGGAAWRAELEEVPESRRHLALHEGHCHEANARDRRHMSPALGATTFSGTPEQLRERLAGLAAQGVGELAYAPLGPDVPRELRAMKAALDGA